MMWHLGSQFEYHCFIFLVLYHITKCNLFEWQNFLNIANSSINLKFPPRKFLEMAWMQKMSSRKTKNKLLKQTTLKEKCTQTEDYAQQKLLDDIKRELIYKENSDIIIRRKCYIKCTAKNVEARTTNELIADRSKLPNKREWEYVNATQLNCGNSLMDEEVDLAQKLMEDPLVYIKIKQYSKWQKFLKSKLKNKYKKHKLTKTSKSSKYKKYKASSISIIHFVSELKKKLKKRYIQICREMTTDELELFSSSLAKYKFILKQLKRMLKKEKSKSKVKRATSEELRDERQQKVKSVRRRARERKYDNKYFSSNYNPFKDARSYHSTYN